MPTETIPHSLPAIFGRSVPITLAVFFKLLVLEIILLGCLSSLEIAERAPGEELQIGLTGVSVVLLLLALPYLIYQGIIASDLLWRGKPADSEAIGKNVSFDKACQLGGLVIRLWFWTTAGLLLFIIPGVVYFINRALATVILVLEELPPQLSIEKSKLIVKEVRWYEVGGPFFRLFLITVAVLVVDYVCTQGIHLTLHYLEPFLRSETSFLLNLFSRNLIHCLVFTYMLVCLVGLYLNIQSQQLAAAEESVPSALGSYRDMAFGTRNTNTGEETEREE